jgi:tRNA (guanine-N7-)-methyltransferase
LLPRSARIWRGAKTAFEEKLPNVVFLRTYIDHLTDYFDPDEVEDIWILFPDPYREKSKARKRLTSLLFLDRYRQIIKRSGLIHLKTDDLQLYEFTIDTLKEQKAEIHFRTDDLYASTLPDEILSVKTFYEQMHLQESKTIKYIKFTVN